MTVWKVTVVARHRARSAKSHRYEDSLISYLFTKTKREASRWAALETIVVVSRYDRGGDYYWDDERSVEETDEFKAPVRRRRKWAGWPAFKERGVWYSRRAIARGEQGVITEKEAHRRNRISRTRRKRRKLREATLEEIPEAPQLNVFYREFAPYETRDAFARVEEPPAYKKGEGDEEDIERLHGEYDELEAGGSPGGRPSDAE